MTVDSATGATSATCSAISQPRSTSVSWISLASPVSHPDRIDLKMGESPPLRAGALSCDRPLGPEVCPVSAARDAAGASTAGSATGSSGTSAAGSSTTCSAATSAVRSAVLPARATEAERVGRVDLDVVGLRLGPVDLGGLARRGVGLGLDLGLVDLLLSCLLLVGVVEGALRQRVGQRVVGASRLRGRLLHDGLRDGLRNRLLRDGLLGDAGLLGLGALT